MEIGLSKTTFVVVLMVLMANSILVSVDRWHFLFVVVNYGELVVVVRGGGRRGRSTAYPF